MLSKEVKQLLELSGGKIIISNGNLEESYLVMKLGDYLKEKLAKKEVLGSESDQEARLEEVNAQVEKIYKNNLEKKLSSWVEEELLEAKKKELEPSYEEITTPE